jgi:8-hydroxy-5-deazaflavin:NADPH oxidoreductase
MRIGILGAGRIGGNLARLLARAGHQVQLSYARDPARLRALASEIGPAASVATPLEACAAAEVVVVSVPWQRLDALLAEVGPLADKIVIDTTNPFGADGLIDLDGETSAQRNQRRCGPRARLVKAFNTLTADFQATAAGRTGAERVVMFYAADDAAAGDTVARLIDDCGFEPLRVGGLRDSAPMEAPRRPGALYGEEYHRHEALAYVEGWQRQRADPPPETYVQRYIRAFATRDYATLDELYDQDVVFYTPLAWAARGRDFVRNFIEQFHTGYPNLRVTLHDEFYSADGTRACFRFVLHYHNAGPFFGQPPTGERGTMSETHSIRIRNGRIVEQWVGDNTFSMPHQELVEWGMAFPRDTPDPLPAILDVETMHDA